MKKTFKIISVIMALLFVSLSFAACGAKSADNARQYVSGAEAADYDVEYGFSSSAQENSKSVSTEEKKDVITDAGTRKLVRKANLDIQTKEFDSFVTAVDKKVTALKGYTESSYISGNSYYSSGNRNAEITVRIPEEAFESFISDISEIATVTSKNVSVSDITGDYVDTESRIKSLEAEQKALIDLMSKAKNVSETLEIQTRLSEVNSDLESCKARMKTFDSLVSYSTVTLDINEVERETAAEQEGFFAEIGRRLSDNLYSIAHGLRRLGIWFISSLPFIAIFAVCVTAVILILRKLIKKRRNRKKQKREESNAESK